MKKLFSLAIYSLLIINAQRFNSHLNTTQTEDSKKINTHWTKIQEDAKGKAGVS